MNQAARIKLTVSMLAAVTQLVFSPAALADKDVVIINGQLFNEENLIAPMGIAGRNGPEGGNQPGLSLTNGMSPCLYSVAAEIPVALDLPSFANTFPSFPVSYFLEDLDKATRVWSGHGTNPNSNMQLRFVGQSLGNPNVITVTAKDQQCTYAPLCLAALVVTTEERNGTQCITNATVEIYKYINGGTEADWAPGWFVDPFSRGTDLGFAHELGHFAGLAHNNNSPVMNASIDKGINLPFTLDPGDLQAMQSVNGTYQPGVYVSNGGALPIGQVVTVPVSFPQHANALYAVLLAVGEAPRMNANEFLFSQIPLALLQLPNPYFKHFALRLTDTFLFGANAIIPNGIGLLSPTGTTDLIFAVPYEPAFVGLPLYMVVLVWGPNGIEIATVPVQFLVTAE